MTRTKGALVIAALLVAAPFEALDLREAPGGPLPLGSIGVSAQARPRNRTAPPDTPLAPGAAPGEIQRLFDAYIVMQAQQALSLTDEQFPRFLTRVRVLQEARRKGLMERGRILQRLRQLSSAGSAGQDDAIRTELKALSSLDERTSTDIRDALVGIDDVLDLRQQARFRLFEEQIERRKMELLMRSRQLNRPRNQSQP